jgi:hypothetical protein
MFQMVDVSAVQFFEQSQLRLTESLAERVRSARFALDAITDLLVGSRSRERNERSRHQADATNQVKHETPPSQHV